MSNERVNIQLRRGGREFRNRSFNLAETRDSTLGELLREDGVTSGLRNFEVYVRQQDSENEVAATNMESTTLDNLLQSASDDGQIQGTYIIDVTAQHVGAATMMRQIETRRSDGEK